jgi:two-component system nitrate/nitrite sensor histidine kinase NarX
VTISVVATAWIVRDQDQDALVINLAGRQRMLLQQITSRALQIQADQNQDEHRQILLDAEIVFDQTLMALMAGGETQYLPGQTVYIPAAGSDTIQAALRELQQHWNEFQLDLKIIETSAPDSVEFASAIQSIQVLSPQLVQQADGIVRLYEAESESKLAHLQWIQITFFLCAVGLLVLGIIITRRAIIIPLQTLKKSAEQIGQGDLSSPVQVSGPPELAALAMSFDTMRAQLKTLTEGLEARVSQRTRELTALYDVIREISSHLEIEHVLNSVTGKARDLIESDVAFLCLLDSTGESLALKAHNGPRNAVCSHCALAKQPVPQQVLDRQDAMICDVGGCQIIASGYRASHLAAPLRVGDRVIGALCVGSTRKATYSHEQVRLLTELANSTAIALENARLYEQAERIGILEERQRIAADMHDGLAQTLSYVRLKTDRLADLIQQESIQQAMREVGLIGDAIDRANHEVRQSIVSLRADPIPERALQGQLAELVSEFAQEKTELKINIVGGKLPSIFVGPDQMTQVSRIVQEALQNACRHAHATRIVVSLEEDGATVRVIVCDDGQGFDVSQVNGKGHFGLSIMQARAARLGGTLVIESASGHGTQVILSWPVRRIIPT